MITDLNKERIRLALIEIFRLRYSVVELPEELLLVINKNLDYILSGDYDLIPFGEMIADIESAFEVEWDCDLSTWLKVDISGTSYGEYFKTLLPDREERKRYLQDVGMN